MYYYKNNEFVSFTEVKKFFEIECDEIGEDNFANLLSDNGFGFVKQGEDYIIFKKDSIVFDGYHTTSELYNHRHMLFATVCKEIGGWKSLRHSDGTFIEGMFIAGTEVNEKPITYHLPIIFDNDNLFDLFPARKLDYAPEWDGHSSEDVVSRLKDYAVELNLRTENLIKLFQHKFRYMVHMLGIPKYSCELHISQSDLFDSYSITADIDIPPEMLEIFDVKISTEYKCKTLLSSFTEDGIEDFLKSYEVI